MKRITTTFAAVLFGMSASAFAAVKDISFVMHASQKAQEPTVDQIAQRRWSDISAVNEKGASNEVQPFTRSAGDYRYGDISAVTHNQVADSAAGFNYERRASDSETARPPSSFFCCFAFQATNRALPKGAGIVGPVRT